MVCMSSSEVILILYSCSAVICVSLSSSSDVSWHFSNVVQSSFIGSDSSWTSQCVLMCWCSPVCVCVCVGKEMVDFIQQYLTRIRERRVVPDVQPGYMRPLLPSSAPNEPEDWSSIMRDVENIIMPGVRLSPVCSSIFPSVCLSLVYPSICYWMHVWCDAPVCPVGGALAESSHARVFPCADLMAVSAGRHAGRRH